jgi:hypothetical protein
MSRIVQFNHEGRELEVRTNVVGETIEVWIFEDGRTLQLFTPIPVQDAADARLKGKDIVALAMNRARDDVETGALKLPPR